MSKTNTVAMLPPMVERETLFGPVTRKLQHRALARWAGSSIVGLLLGLAGSPALTAIGLGAVWPGAGLFYAGHPVLALLTLPVFVVSLLLWVLAGAAIMPVVVWAAAALLAGSLAQPGHVQEWARPAVPLVAVLLGAGLYVRKRRAHPASLAKVRELNAHFQTQPMRTPQAQYVAGEALDEQELGAMRFMLDLALQPIDRFDGFTTIDQFREAAWRYQLYALSESLAMLRATRLPSFRGYVEQAQRNAIVKMTDRRVWSYWFWENLWGNLKVDPDPMVRENIMISGWFATALGAYATTTGDDRFDRPGALPFRWSAKKVFDYDYPKIAETLVRNFGKDELCLFPCEPNWVFSYCNEEGISGLVLYDRTHGTDHAAKMIARFRERIDEEFTLADGGMVVIYANRIGLPLGGRAVGLFAGSCWLRNMYAPDLAQRTWAQVRHEFLQPGADPFVMAAGDRLDSGDYRKSEGNLFYPLLMCAAREMGDDEVYAWARRKHDALGSVEKDGARRWPGSTFANLTSHMGRFGARDAWYRLANVDWPKAWCDGPMLESAPYPRALVARAVSDGSALDLVLQPGDAGGAAELGFSQLRPGVAYRLDGAGPDIDLRADSRGLARAGIQLDRRVELRLRPLA